MFVAFADIEEANAFNEIEARQLEVLMGRQTSLIERSQRRSSDDESKRVKCTLNDEEKGRLDERPLYTSHNPEARVQILPQLLRKAPGTGAFLFARAEAPREIAFESEEAVVGVYEASFYWYRDFVHAQRSGLEVAWRVSA